MGAALEFCLIAGYFVGMFFTMGLCKMELYGMGKQ